MEQDQEQAALNRYLNRMPIREHHLMDLLTKTPFEVDTPERVALRKKLISREDSITKEKVIVGNDIMPFNYLAKGTKAGKSVCRIVTREESGRVFGYGSGFLVTPTLLLTNNHVLQNFETASLSSAQFDYEADVQFQEFRLAPEVFFMTNTELDFTLVAVQEQSTLGKNLKDYGYLPLVKQTGKILLGEYVSVIQHPKAELKAVVLRENKLIDVLENFLHYTADTNPGSSGSPVFNDSWMVVGLHHASVPDPNQSGKYIANEGVRISRILEFIERESGGLRIDQKRLLDHIATPVISDHPIENDFGEEEDIPFNLERFEGFTGYDPAFLGDGQKVVPHPKLRSDLANDVAKQSNGEYILPYTHFSVVMSKSRRLAYYTVVNIDGKQLRDEKRVKWRMDPRIDQRYQCGNELYKDNKLDRGHLVRRRDPIWGNQSNEANADTFHYTNCSPQHENFNQSENLWLGLEDYLLNHVENNKQEASVFTGPIFRENDIVYRGVKIPEEFWKVAVVVKDGGELSATAYLVSQKQFMNDLEANVPGAFKTFQVKVSLIEGLTGLDFGSLRNYDPMERIESTIGHLIETERDIRL
ncbi:DNA/RNA non-specific endonuclease [Paenibacillus sp. FSL R7-0331]|uniref:DNA/RNA non-specific endonuclease n=1 Tax=Paenibacillus sp. FSL R7-0331 TaxID=1536773 RepID=UPI001E3ECAD5|nr:DNA/RNA non-specific endonuclease [Paenibacillus sp. FSL R7-0331]